MLHIQKGFGYGSIFDGCEFEFQGTEEEFLSKIKDSGVKSSIELIYKKSHSFDDTTDWGYKSGGFCHVCNKDILENAHREGSNLNEVFSSLMETCVIFGPFEDPYGTHYANVCEECFEKYFKDNISESKW